MGDGFEPMQLDDFAEENENDLNILAVNGVNNVRQVILSKLSAIFLRNASFF
jgi:hypothetical protein